MADTYPTNDEYAKETLRSDGGSAAGGFAAGKAVAKGLSKISVPFSIAGLKKSMRATQAEAAGDLNMVGAAASKKKKKKSKKGPR